MHGPRAACVLVGVALLFAAGCDNGEQSVEDANKVTICHATSSASNPYTRDRVAKDGAVSGHDGHAGDIIPPFTYFDNAGVQHQYPGKNMGNGQAILDAGCDVPGSTTSAASGGAATTDNTPKGSPPATDGSDVTDSSVSSGPDTTLSRDSTPPAIAGPTTPTTTAASGPTTTSSTSSGGVPPAVAAGTTTTSSTATTNQSGQAEAEAPAGLGSTTTPSAGESAAAPTSTGDSALADTGTTSTPLLIGALLLMLLGTLGVVVARRREAT